MPVSDGSDSNSEDNQQMDWNMGVGNNEDEAEVVLESARLPPSIVPTPQLNFKPISKKIPSAEDNDKNLLFYKIKNKHNISSS